MLKILIVEDEKMTSEMIAQMVSGSFPDALIVGQVDSVANGISEIIKHKPDIILLDINLKDGN